MSIAYRKYKEFMNKTFRAPQRKYLIAAFKEFFPPENATVLDIGAGNGEFTRILQNAMPQLTFTGVEVMERGEPQIPITIYDGNKIPFEDKSFDYAILINMLHHTPDPKAVMIDALRVSRKGIIIKDHYANNWFDYATLKGMEYANPNAKTLLERPLRFLSRKEWEEKFRELGVERLAYNDKFTSYGKFWDIFFGRKMHFIGKYK